jgi:hypothetical protein
MKILAYADNLPQASYALNNTNVFHKLINAYPDDLPEKSKYKMRSTSFQICVPDIDNITAD